MGARLLVRQISRGVTRVGHPAGQRHREEGEEMSQTALIVLGAVLAAVVILLIIVL